MFKKPQWEKLMEHPPFVLPVLTREFYAGIPEKIKGRLDPNFSVVSGWMVSFTAERINDVLGLPNAEESLEDMVDAAIESDMNRLLRELCLPRAEWIKEDPSNYKVKRTMLKPLLRPLSLWVMSSVLPTSHNFHWHKERMFLLDAMLQARQFNLGRVMEREILVYARRNEGRLYYPNLIRLLCEAEDMPRFDQDEEDFMLDPMVQLSCEGEKKEKVEEKAKEENKVEEKEEKAEEVPQMNELMMLLQQHILKQEAIWVFVKAAHEWYTLGFGETILPPPVFPDWVLPDAGPSSHAQDKPDDAAYETPAAQKKKVDEEDADDGAAKSTTAPEKTILLDSDEDDIPIPTDNVADNEETQSAHAPDNAGEVSGTESAAAERERKSKNDEERRKEKEKTPVADATRFQSLLLFSCPHGQLGQEDKSVLPNRQ